METKRITYRITEFVSNFTVRLPEYGDCLPLTLQQQHRLDDVVRSCKLEPTDALLLCLFEIRFISQFLYNVLITSTMSARAEQLADIVRYKSQADLTKFIQGLCSTNQMELVKMLQDVKNGNCY